MTSIIQFTALSGGTEASTSFSSNGKGNPHCYLLQVDEFTFLLDCGWDEKGNMEHVERIKRHVDKVTRNTGIKYL
jgi:cleavage and polyadenylation specificity factor subunit 2